MGTVRGDHFVDIGWILLTGIFVLGPLRRLNSRVRLLRHYCQTQHFTQRDIDEYRETFYLYAQKGTLENPGHLRYIMRCIGCSPTVEESQVYFKKKNGKIDFACFLDLLHEHKRREKPASEIMTAFRTQDKTKKGTIPAKELRSLLMGTGEKLSALEVDRIFKEANITSNSMVRYEDFVNVLSSPLPDY